mgnify:CR=1 FL=1
MDFQDFQDRVIINAKQFEPIHPPFAISSDNEQYEIVNEKNPVQSSSKKPNIVSSSIMEIDNKSQSLTINDNSMIIESIPRGTIIEIFQNDLPKEILPLTNIELISWLHDEYEQVDWDAISKDQRLTEVIMKQFIHKLNWDLISQYQVLSEKALTQFEDELNPLIILQYQKCLNGGFALDVIKKIDWSKVNEEFMIDDQLIIDHRDAFDWTILSKYLLFTNRIAIQFCYRIKWDLVCRRNLKHHFIKAFSKHVIWDLVCQYSSLDDKSIRLFASHLNWNIIVQFQQLSEEILLEFVDDEKLEYGLVKKHQKNFAAYDKKILQRDEELRISLEKRLNIVKQRVSVRDMWDM